MFNVSTLCMQNVRLFQQKLLYKLISPHKHYLGTNKTHFLRITQSYKFITLLKLAPSPSFSIINVHLVAFNVFAKFDEIPSLPFQILKKDQNMTDIQKEGQRAITLTELATRPHYINVFSKFDEIPSLPFQDIKETLQKERRTDIHCENSILPTNTVCGV